MGIFYNKECQAEAARLISDWTLEEMQQMRDEVRRCKGKQKNGRSPIF